MKIALVTNTAWLDEELLALEQTTVGLLGESVQVVKLLPAVAMREAGGGFTNPLAWQESNLKWLNTHRLAGTLPKVRAQAPGVIHALDGRVWAGALKLALSLDVPAVLSVNSPLDLPQIKKLSRIWRKVPKCCFLAPTQPLWEKAYAQQQAMMGRQATAVALSEPLDHQAIMNQAGASGPEADHWAQLIYPGVHPGEQIAKGLDSEDRPRCVAVVGTGQLNEHYEALLAGVARFVGREKQTQFFFDGMVDDQQQLYRQARRLGLLQNVSFSPRRLGHRQMLLRADALLQPEPIGRARGVLLQAMAHGLPVIAQADPWLDFLINETTCWAVDSPQADRWDQALTRLVREPDQARTLGEQAKNWVRENRLMASYVEALLTLYEQLEARPIRMEKPGKLS